MTNEEINRAVAAIAGWTEIENWNTSATNKTYIGTNAAHPELGKFIPKYTESLDTIVKVFDCLGLDWNTGKDCDAYSLVNEGYDHRNAFGETPAIALCKLLLAINPTPIAPPQIAIIDDDGEHD
jgi:hypothetical protein